MLGPSKTGILAYCSTFLFLTISITYFPLFKFRARKFSDKNYRRQVALNNVVPVIISVIEAVEILEIPNGSCGLKKNLECALEHYLQMLLSAERPLPLRSGTNVSKALTNEYVVASYFRSRYLTEMQVLYAYYERMIGLEMERMYRNKVLKPSEGEIHISSEDKIASRYFLREKIFTSWWINLSI